MRKTALFLASALAAVSAGGCGEKKMPELTMPKVFQAEKPEVKIQSQIAAVLAADNEEQYYKQLSGLFERSREVGWQRRQLIEAVIDYSEQVSGPDQLGRYNRMLASLDIPRSAIVEAAAPKLAVSQGAAADANRALLKYAAPPDPRSRADFSHFRQYLESHSSPPPAKLVLWMYDHDPASALWQMSEIYGQSLLPADRKTIQAGEHVVSEILFRQQAGLLSPGEFESAAVAQLTQLAHSREWWVRLYVANILLKQPQLRKAELIDLLKNDTDVLVKETMGRVG